MKQNKRNAREELKAIPSVTSQKRILPEEQLPRMGSVDRGKKKHNQNHSAANWNANSIECQRRREVWFA